MTKPTSHAITAKFSEGKGLQANVVSALDGLAFKPENPVDHRVTIGTITFNQLRIDSRIQRDEDWGLINAISRAFDPDAVGTVVVSVRTDENNVEEWVCLDGQQRSKGGILAGWGDKPFKAVMHYGLNLRDEARLFRELNTRKSVNAPTLFKVAIAEGDENVLAIAAILTDLQISFGTPKGFNAVQVARRLARRRGGLLHLRWALQIMQRTYGSVDEARGIYDGRVIEALALIHEEYGTLLNEHNLTNKLSAEAGGVAGLLGRAKTIGSLKPGRMVYNVIDAIIASYNKYKHRDANTMLPEWDRGTRTVRSAKLTDEERAKLSELEGDARSDD